MNMRKIIAVLAAALMLCAAIPMAAISVSAAPGDVIIDADFNDGTDGFHNFSVADGALVLDGTSADWANSYAYANAIKPSTTYQVNFRAKADTNKALSFKINNGWNGTNVQESVNITTEWQEFELLLTPDSSLTSPIFTIQTGTYASGGTVYYIDYVKVTEYQDPAEIGKVVNGSFEDGIANWNTDSSASLYTGDASEGSASLKLENTGYYASAATQTIPVKANTVYELSWKSKRLSGNGAFNVILCQPTSPYTNFTKVSGQNWMNETSGNWVNNSFTVNTGDNTSMLIKWTSERSGDAGAILLDDIRLIEVKDPSFDGYIYNGDFETGKSDSWTNLWGSNAVEIVEGRDGGYALKATASGAYNIVYQEVNVTPNTNYTVWAYTKNASGSNLWIKNAGGNGDITNKAFASGDWALTSVSFNSGSNNKVWVGLMGLNAGSTYIVDDVFMFEAKEQSNDGYIKNGTFETGSISPWDNLWGSCPTVEIIKGGKDDTFALNLVSGQWKHFRQTNIAVEANTDYKISFYSKNVKNMNLLVKDGADTTNVVNKGIADSDDWALTEITFNTGAYTSILISLMGGAEEAYGKFDNIVMEKLHTCSHVETSRTDATCGADGSVTYTCSCGDSYTETLPATGEHVYFDDCSAICEVCGYEREAGHNVIHVEAAAPTCVAMGNIEYWYCDVCGMAWLDAECTMNTNLRAVKLAATGEHTYDNDFDADCNVCGGVRDVVCPLNNAQKSISEDVNGYAVKFDCAAEGFAIKAGTFVQADYTNATYNGYKLVKLGVIASNGTSETNIEGLRMYDLEDGVAKFAFRVINIPAEKQNVEITMTPYYIVEIDGVETTLYGEAITGSYAEIAG